MATPTADESTWAATFHTATVALMSFDYRTAINQYRLALEVAERLSPDSEPLAKNLEGLAHALSHAGESAAAISLLSRANELRLKLLTNIEFALGPRHLDVAECLDNLACNHRWQGKSSEAITVYQRALEIRTDELGEDHYDVATTLERMANVYSVHCHDRVNAARHWKRAIAILDRLHENPETCDAQVTNLLRVILELLGLNAYEQDNGAAAKAWFRRVAGVTTDAIGSPGIAPIYAKVLVRRQKFEDAEIVLNAASQIDMRAPAWGKACKEAMIDLYEATGRHNEAESLQKEA